MIREFAAMGVRQNLLAVLDNRLLPGRETLVQWNEEIQEALRQIAFGVESLRSAVELESSHFRDRRGHKLSFFQGGHCSLPRQSLSVISENGNLGCGGLCSGYRLTA